MRRIRITKYYIPKREREREGITNEATTAPTLVSPVGKSSQNHNYR
jgi:hypothetical protein